MRGFFHKSELLAMGGKPDSNVARCSVCQLEKQCESPRMEAGGLGGLNVLIVGEAPGSTEDQQGTQFVGKTGKHLQEVLHSIGIDMEDDTITTNAIVCQPPNNRTPNADELQHCRPFLSNTIKDTQPNVIIPLGDTALKQVLAPYWDLNFGLFSRWAGFQIPLQPLNAWVCPTWHPSFIVREKNEMLDLWFKKHLEAAFCLKEKPWNPVPDYKAMVEQVDDCSTVLKEMETYEGASSFDYETNMIKPDWEDAVVVSASITWGKGKAERCVAFALDDNNMACFRKYLRSPIPKVGANIKFEQRWSMRFFNTRVRNWVWDTMICSHVLDHREKITSQDFQAFINLGLPPYSSHIKPLLKAKKGLTVNQILTEISLPQLLTYNGLDTISEYEVAIRQMKKLKMPPPWRK